MFKVFGNCLIQQVSPKYANETIHDVDIENEVFALDSTTIFLSLKLFSRAPGKYSRGAVKILTLLDLKGNIPSFILITDGKYHDSSVLDVLISKSDAIYLIDKAYIDFEDLYNMHKLGVFFVSSAISNMNYSVIERNYNIIKKYGFIK